MKPSKQVILVIILSIPITLTLYYYFGFNDIWIYLVAGFCLGLAITIVDSYNE